MCCHACRQLITWKLCRFCIRATERPFLFMKAVFRLKTVAVKSSMQTYTGKLESWAGAREVIYISKYVVISLDGKEETHCISRPKVKSNAIYIFAYVCSHTCVDNHRTGNIKQRKRKKYVELSILFISRKILIPFSLLGSEKSKRAA